MQTMTNLITDKTTTPVSLPDDPREICRLILKQLHRIDDWPVGSMAEDFARLVRSVCEGPSEALLEARGGLLSMSATAQDAGELHRDVIRNLWDLAAHGTGDHREADAA
jgi:hypothetical protein